MAVQTKTITVSTNGYSDVVDLTNKVEEILVEQDINTGIVSLFIPGSTAGLTTIEYEPGCVQDMKNALERIFPESDQYAHNARWGDGNGFSHMRAAFLGPSLQIPFRSKHLMRGTWQQVILIDFDNKPRNREVVLQFIGE
ncbi:MAG: secondary thiamine-phosphate synthase enzyme YjbQ [Acidobacteriia bacterium]|nr:secondary thiamine-phosphate synthase enzyme YjbQ [Terriglobia bacterium]